jgi:hypothetical protein
MSWRPTLTSVLDGVDDQRHDPAALPPGKIYDTYCTGGSLDGSEIFHLYRDSIPEPSSRIERSNRLSYSRPRPIPFATFPLRFWLIVL